ncbi:hypothetical protein F5Y04DRAFT_276079 [Hypomontagnella monticulosa]|nr:hypothetical protein F5Y04DRAFT_276079 [Hypomontagnella monticulosa]
MSQQNIISDAASLPRGRPLSFLDFPKHIRRTIYEYAGLLVGATILITRNRGFDIDYFTLDTTLCDLNFTEAILLTSKAIHEETTTILFSENNIKVPWNCDIRSLRSLQGMPSRHLKKFTNLYVGLRFENSSDWGYKPGSPLTKRKIAAWRAAITNVLSRLEPQKVNLSLVCDTRDPKTLASVVEPLVASPGILKNIELRFDEERLPYLSELAEETANQIMGYKKPKHFRFFDLPKELRLSILEYTDLVTPSREVKWDQRESKFAVLRKPHKHCPSDCSDMCHEHARQFLECLAYPKMFCRKARSAYTSKCRCWVPPVNLMLVNKSMYSDSRGVFYTQNRFHLTYDFMGSYEEPISLGDLVTTKFGPNPLSSIRTLEFGLRILEHPNEIDVSDPEFGNWLDVISELKEHANVEALTIVLHMYTLRSELPFPLPIILNSGDDVEEDGGILRALLYESYMFYIRPLHTLGGLKRLFVSLERNWHWSTGSSDEVLDLGLNDDGIAAIGAAICEMESSLEREIMGDKYNSAILGKADLNLRAWKPLT